MRHPVFLFFLLLASAGFSQAPSRSKFVYEEGKALMEQNPAKAFTTLEAAMRMARQNHEEEIYLKSLLELVWLVGLDYPDQQKKVFDWCKQASRHVLDKKSILTAELYFSTADFYSKLTSETDSAIFYFREALKIRQVKIGEKSELVAACYHGLGDVYKYRTYDFNEAEKWYEKALRIREQIPSSDLFSLTTNYYNLATTNRSQRDFDRALPYGISTIKLCEEMEDTTFLEQAYTVVANIYRDMSQPILAQEYYQKAIALNLIHNQSPSLLAWNYIGLGEAFKNDSAWNNAITSFNKGMVIIEGLEKKVGLSANNKQLLVDCQFQLASVYQLQQNYPAAWHWLKRHFATARRLQLAKGRKLFESLKGFGDFYQEMGRYDSALYYYQQALSVAIPAFSSKDVVSNPADALIGRNYYIHSILSSKAHIFLEQFNTLKKKYYLVNAISCLQVSERLLSMERSELDAEESKWLFMDEHFDVYEQLLKALFLQQQIKPSDSIQALVFYYMERSKVRSLNDALIQAEQNFSADSNDSLIQKLDDFKTTWFALEHRLETEQQRSLPDSVLLTGLRKQQVILDRNIKKIKEQIEIHLPGYSRAKFSRTVTSLVELQRFLRDENRILLEYFYGKESVYGLAVSKNRVEFERVGAADSIQGVITEFLQHFSDNHSSLDKVAFNRFSNSAHTLYQYLMKPFQSVVSGSESIQIVPDGLISQIPFELLLTEKPTWRHVDYKMLKYALRQTSFGYAYSAELMVNNSRSAMRKPAMLAMGFTGGNRVRGPDEQLAEIEGAELELEALQHQFGDGKFMMGPEVTEFNFKKLAPGFDIIHLAIHGRGDPYSRFSSSLFFRTAYDSVDDGQLHAYELYGLKLMARLAVLTACESGLGKQYKGEGALSMATAFTYSGCQNTLMSLWKVNDQTSVELMQHFYDQLLQGQSIHQALTKAKLDYLTQADEFTADPVLWAPMVAYGNLDPVFKEEKSKTVYVAGGFVIVLLFAGWFFFNRRLKT